MRPLSRFRPLRPFFVCLLLFPTFCSTAQVTWRRAIGGVGSDRAACVRQTADGGYIVAGSTGSFGNGSGDIYLVRLDPDGVLLWSRTYGGPGVETGVSCRELADGFAIAGTTFTGSNGSYDMVLIRTGSEGDVLWERNYGTSDWDLCAAMDVVGDGFFLSGTSFGNGASAGAAYVVRTDADGEVLWTALSDAEEPTEAFGITATADQGAIISGAMATAGQADDAFLMKLDASGAIAWTTPVGGASDDVFSSAVQDADGSYAAIGSTKSLNPYMQIYLVGIDAEGAVEWQRDIGSVADAAGSEVRIDHTGGYVFTGYNTLNQGERDMILTITDNEGWWQLGNNYGNGQPADGLSIDPTDDGGYVVAGWCENYGTGPRSMYVVKTDDQGQTENLTVIATSDPLSIDPVALVSTHALFPIPVASGGTLHLRQPLTGDARIVVMDIHGRSVAVATLDHGALSFAVPTCPSGIYMVDVSTASSAFRSRIVVE